MANYRISYIGDSSISNVHHIGVEYDGNFYSVIIGEYVNGGFCCIPNWNVGCELANLSDVFWNKESIGRVLKSKKAAGVIATAIKEYMENNNEKK